jgi:DNA polymerase III subunit gamma/tau
MLGSDLEKAELPAISGPNTLALRFPARYNHPREHCQEPKAVSRIEEVLRKITGQPWGIRVETGGQEPVHPSPAPASEADPSPSRSQRQLTEALQEPLVKRAIEVFGAQIVHQEEGFGAAPTEAGERAEAAEAPDTEDP